MSERYRAAVHVDLAGIEPKLAQHRNGLDRERFVEFDRSTSSRRHPIFLTTRRTASTGVINTYLGARPLVA
jgi:hypothetical protein